jgi:hypothetical protein
MNNEPVAWMVDGVLFTSLGAALNISFDIEQPCIPLYTHPVKELTDEEIWDFIEKHMGVTFLGRCYRQSQFNMCKAILRKAQEK